MNKKLYILIIAFLVAVSIIGVTVDVRLGSTVSAQNNDYEDLKIFTEVLTTIKRNYVEEVETKDLIYDALHGMIKSLDPHSAFLTPESFKEMKVSTKGEFGGLGIQISIRDDVLTIIAPIEDTPAYRIGLKAGDKIVKIEDEITKDMSLFDAVKRMRGKKGTPVTITITREGLDAPKAYTIVRAIIKIKSVKSKMLDDNIAYIKLNAFQERSSKDMAKALKKLVSDGATGIILDLRNNPGGLLTSAIEISSYFLPRNQLVVYTKGRSGVKTEYRARGNAITQSMPMVVLINQGSASASEIVAGALKDWKRAVILGSNSFGKASVQSVIPLSDGAGLRITTAKYYTPKGTLIQNTGITPDISVKLNGSNGAKAHAVIREKDLKGRLDNEQTGDDDKKPEPKIISPKDGEKAVSLREIKEKDDNQLNRAKDLLKTWVVFKELPKE
jgi:carboxyl-terminal processing protease